jgi:hypothetical protein
MSKFLTTAVTTVSNAAANSVNDISNAATDAANSALSDVTGISQGNNFLNTATRGLLSGLSGAVGEALGGIIGDDDTFKSILSDPISIITRGQADLIGLTGGRFDSLVAQFDQLKDRTNFSGEFIDTGYKSPFSASGESASRIPNPLRNHNGYNYIITLGVLSPQEYNNPSSYRSAGGFSKILLKSGGGNLDKRYQVFDETGGGTSEHAEYYIDDIDLEAVIAPNPNTGVAMGTNLSFTVTEPYSMGNFVEAIIGIARETGYQNYLDAPFCLKFDFVGWNEGGQSSANFLQRPIFIPIKITTVDFNVSGTGSIYQVKAVPMSESGLSDTVNHVKTPIKATGTLVHEILETSIASVSGGINAQIEALEDSEAISSSDRYVIVFPKDRTALVDALKQNEVDESAFTTTVEDAIKEQKGSTKDLTGETYQGDKVNNVEVKAASSTFAILKTYAEDEAQMNAIGISAVTTSSNVGGNQAEAEPAGAIDPNTGKVDASSQAAQASDKARDYQFGQGERITKIIEKIVNQSEYAAEKATEGSTNGLNKWYKIDTQVFIDENAETEYQLGRPPKVYVYSVVEYEVDEAHVLSTNQKPLNTEGLKKAAAKEYNYIYTGKNEDVLNFDINFNQAFMQTALSNFGMNKGGVRGDNHKTNTAVTETTTSATPPKDTDLTQKTEAGAPIEQAAALGTESGGTVNPDIRRQIAEMFHDRITNLPLDMVTAEMEIMGDPFFIPQETGNYVAPAGDSPNATEDGTMTYQQSEVFCVVNFKTPFDYQIKGATMEMPTVVPGFSGLFSVWAVTNRFSRGQFTQTLKLIRRRGQDDPATTNNKAFVEVNDGVDIKEKPIIVDGEPGNPNPPIPPSQDEFDNAVCDDSKKLTFGVDDIAKLVPALDVDIPDLPTEVFGINPPELPAFDLDVIGSLPDYDEIASTVSGFDVGALAPALPAIPAVPPIPELPDLFYQPPAPVSTFVNNAVNDISDNVSSAVNDALQAGGASGTPSFGPSAPGPTVTTNPNGTINVTATNPVTGDQVGFSGNPDHFQISAPASGFVPNPTVPYAPTGTPTEAGGLSFQDIREANTPPGYTIDPTTGLYVPIADVYDPLNELTGGFVPNPTVPNSSVGGTPIDVGYEGSFQYFQDQQNNEG